VWIDNFIFAADDLALLESIERQFRRLATDLQFCLKDTVWGPQLDLLGARVDLWQRSITVTDSSRKTLSDALNDCLSSPTARSFAHWLGCVLFINFAIRRTPLCQFHTTLDTLRDIARSGCWDSQITISDALEEEMRTMSSQHAYSRWTAEMVQAPLDVSWLSLLWTDASTLGVGGFSQDPDGSVSGVFAEGYDVPQNRIYAFELLAGLMGSQITPRSYVWMVDNEAAARSIIKGHSASSRGDRILRQWWSSSCWPSAVCMVPTACQRSDGLSRGVLAIPPPCAHPHLVNAVATRCRSRLPGE
jgi:hypothetical protein